MPQPIYSHGGVSQSGFPAVLGTAQNSGRPVAIVQAIADPAMQFFFTGTSVTVLIEGNGGLIDTTGNPPTTEWIDYSAGGYTIGNNGQLSKFLPRSIPYWRTRITAITAPTGSGLVSYVPIIIGPNGVLVSASYPQLTSGLQSYT